MSEGLTQFATIATDCNGKVFAHLRRTATSITAFSLRVFNCTLGPSKKQTNQGEAP
jgi:hypothetical protein